MSLFLAVGIILGSESISNAQIEGIDYVDVEVKGVKYPCPVGNTTRSNELYMIKRALAGDAIAREMALGGREQLDYYCGDDVRHTWIHLNLTDEWVTQPGGLN